jgi:uncharacterized protein YcaQ
MTHKVTRIKKNLARNVWINAQRLDVQNPFANGPESVTKAVEHLGYVQIDTINVIERCHHHILYNRIPHYKRNYLKMAQSEEKTVFEYWTHALSYVPVRDYNFYFSEMKKVDTSKGSWFGAVKMEDYKKVKKILKNGPVAIRDIKDDELKEKEHDWDSKKPSKRALQMGFYTGEFVVSRREGMLKIYDLTERHFKWSKKPKAVSDKMYTDYIIDRALKAQGIVSLDSICHLNNSQKKAVQVNLQNRIKNELLLEVQIENDVKNKYWVQPETLDKKIKTSHLTHILSPFDPLIIQRKRLLQFFDYNHVFEAYVPKVKRKFGYFTLPVLSENNIIALLDLKTDRQAQKLSVQNWLWLNKFKSTDNKKIIENELHRFEKFQLAKD